MRTTTKELIEGQLKKTAKDSSSTAVKSLIDDYAKNQNKNTPTGSNKFQKNVRKYQHLTSEASAISERIDNMTKDASMVQKKASNKAKPEAPSIPIVEKPGTPSGSSKKS